MFEGRPTPDKCVRFDPRDATVEAGERYFTTALDNLCAQVDAAYAALHA